MTRFRAEFSRDVSVVLLKLEVNGKYMGNWSQFGDNHENTKKKTYVGNGKPTIHFKADC